MSAFEQGLQRAEGRRQDREAQDNLQRKFLADQYQTYANNIRLPDATQDPEGYKKALDLKQQALDAMQKVYSPDHHATLAEHIHGLIFGPKQAQGAPRSSQASTLPPTPVEGAGQPIAPPATAPAHPFAHNPVYGDILKGLDALGSHLKAAVHPNGPQQPLPKLSTFAGIEAPDATDLLAEKYAKYEELAKGKTPEEQERLAELFGIKHGSVAVKNVVSPDGKRTQAVDVNSPEASALFAEGWKLAPTGAGGYIRQGSHVVNPDDAIKLISDVGEKFPKQDGTDWTADEIAKLPKGTVLSAFIKGDQTFYAPFDERTKTATWDNQVHQINEAGDISEATTNPLGAARVPTVGTHQVPGMNPGEKITLTSTTTPVTPQTKLTPVSPSQANREAINGKLNGKKSKSKQVPAADSVAGIPPPAFAAGTMLSQGRNAEPVVASMNTVAAQVFGGNGEPPLWSNAWMFDKPELRTALNKALTLNALAIPGTEDDPSFTQTLATSLGVTGWTQEQIQAANIKAREDLQSLGGDQATEMFARMAGMQEDLSALRSATKGSAAQSSIRTLVRAAPIYNVASSKNFRDQLGVTLNTAAAAMSGYPAINPKYIDWWKQGARAARGNPVSSNAPKVGSGTIVQKSPSTGKYRYSTDGGKTWQPGQPPNQ